MWICKVQVVQLHEVEVYICRRLLIKPLHSMEIGWAFLTDKFSTRTKGSSTIARYM